MNKTGKGQSSWRLMMVGRSSVILKRLFVVGLAVVSLAVWAVTVIGIGLFRSREGQPGTVQTAQASPAMRAVEPQAAGKGRGEEAKSSALAGIEVEKPQAKLVGVAPERDPFVPSVAYFPTAKVEQGVTLQGAEGVAKSSAGEPAAREEVDRWLAVMDSLTVLGTMRKGEDYQAMIDDGQPAKRGESKRLVFGEGESVRGLRIKEVTSRLVVFTSGERDYVVEIKQ